MNKNRRKVDLVVISDAHLGTYGCRAKELNRYLKSIFPKRLILNGDIIDIWQFSKRYWPKAHMSVLKQILNLASKGTKVYYLTGNHDETLRKFEGLAMGNIQIANKLELDGKRVWFFHGDVFDVIMQYSKWLARLGAISYGALVLINVLVNKISSLFGQRKVSLSKKIKDNVKTAVKYINNFEETAAALAIQKGFDYVVCGHIHQAEDRSISDQPGNAIRYLNSGDWVENLTALEYYKKQWNTYRGLSFIFGKNGGIDMWNTYVEANQNVLMNEIDTVPVEDYDFIINDFEPVSAWACYKRKVPCIALSHQAAVLDKNAPQPKKKDVIGKFILRNYAPSNVQFGFRFSRYSNHIYTPVIRNEIRQTEVKDKGHYTVYLPAYSDEKLIRVLNQIQNIKWEVFSKQSRSSGYYGNVHIIPINNMGFIESLSTCRGVITGAGFETPAEALQLGKKLLVVPMKSQYEQKCNAAALKSLGVSVIKKFGEKRLPVIREWIDSENQIEIDYPDVTQTVIKQVFEEQVLDLLKENNWDTDYKLKFPEIITA